MNLNFLLKFKNIANHFYKAILFPYEKFCALQTIRKYNFIIIRDTFVFLLDGIWNFLDSFNNPSLISFYLSL